MRPLIIFVALALLLGGCGGSKSAATTKTSAEASSTSTAQLDGSASKTALEAVTEGKEGASQARDQPEAVAEEQVIGGDASPSTQGEKAPRSATKKIIQERVKSSALMKLVGETGESKNVFKSVPSQGEGFATKKAATEGHASSSKGANPAKDKRLSNKDLPALLVKTPPAVGVGATPDSGESGLAGPKILGSGGPSALPPKSSKGAGFLLLPSATVVGSCDKDRIRRSVGRHHPRFLYCYQRVLRNEPNLHGAVKAKWTVKADGKVAQVSTSGLKAVGPCVKAMIGRAGFAKPDKGVCKVTQSFLYSPTISTR